MILNFYRGCQSLKYDMKNKENLIDFHSYFSVVPYAFTSRLFQCVKLQIRILVFGWDAGITNFHTLFCHSFMTQTNCWFIKSENLCQKSWFMAQNTNLLWSVAERIIRFINELTCAHLWPIIKMRCGGRVYPHVKKRNPHRKLWRKDVPHVKNLSVHRKSEAPSVGAFFCPMNNE